MGVERRDARLQPAENGVGAGDRDLLRDDDRRQAGEAGFAPAQRRRTADGDQLLDHFPIMRPQALGRLGERRFVGDQGSGMVAGGFARRLARPPPLEAAFAWCWLAPALLSTLRRRGDLRASPPRRLLEVFPAISSLKSPCPMSAPNARPVFRFAPSPNGALHLGHAYSALINQRLAAESGGALLLRIEDLDRRGASANTKTRS